MANSFKRRTTVKSSIILMFLVCIAISGCGLFGKVKKPIASRAAEISKDLSVKVLGCDTGEAVREDVQEELERLFKVQDSSSSKMASEPKSIVGDLCSYSVGLVLPYLVNLADNKLPESWQEDGCSLDYAGDKLEGLAKKLCGEIDI